jgi:RNA polymerase sigma-70 factor (ECF subfamily)
MDTRTTTQLLEALKNPSNEAMWSTFDQRYRPILIAFAVQYGLSHADSEDAAQMALSDFSILYHRGGYDRSKGRLRSWLIGIALKRIASLRRSNARALQAAASLPGESVTHPPSEDEAAWNEAVRKAVLERALSELRVRTRLDDRTISAFELTALRGVAPEAAAATCGMSVDEVYVAKNRVTRKLRDITAELLIELDDE